MGEWWEKTQGERGWELSCGGGSLEEEDWGAWEARLCPLTHHLLGVQGRVHFFGVASDLQR